MIESLTLYNLLVELIGLDPLFPYESPLGMMIIAACLFFVMVVLIILVRVFIRAVMSILSLGRYRD